MVLSDMDLPYCRPSEPNPVGVRLPTLIRAKPRRISQSCSQARGISRMDISEMSMRPLRFSLIIFSEYWSLNSLSLV